MKNIFKTSLLVVLSCLMAGSVWGEVIFSYTLTKAETGLGTYNANGGTAECKRAMAVDGSNEVKIGSQTFYKFNTSSNWVFTLNKALAVGDVITCTCACHATSNKSGKGLKLNDVSVTNDFPASTAKTLVITVAAGDAFVGKNVISMFRNDSDIKFGTIEITRNGGGEEEKSSDATLKELKVGGVDVALEDGQLEYEVELPYGTTEVPTDITAIKNHPKAKSISITNATTLSGTTTIVVTAEDDSQLTYKITFTVADPPKSSDATLKDLQVNGTTIEGFARTTYTYTYLVPSSTTTAPIVTATKGSDAPCSIGKGYDMSGGGNFNVGTITIGDTTYPDGISESPFNYPPSN